MSRLGPRARRLGLLAAITAAAAGGACSSGPPTVGARFGEPTSIVVFAGVTRKNGGLYQYLAVPSRRNDDVVFIDPADDQPALGPGVVFPASISTDSRPLLVAAASLGDRDTGGADALAVLSAGSHDLQVIETWTSSSRVSSAASVPLGEVPQGAPALPAGSEITAAIGLTAPGAGPGAARGRILVGAALSPGLGGRRGRLVAVDFTRDPQSGAVVPQPPVFQDLDFVPAAFAVEPGGTRVFIATRDALASGGATVFGVAMVDAADPGAMPWPVVALDARAPTTALTAARVRERLVDRTDPLSQDRFDATERLRVYAILDPDGCGPDQPIDCGVVALDPDVIRQDGRLGLVPDPAGELPYRAPIAIPSTPAAIAVGLPPASGAQRLVGDANNPSGIPLLSIEPGTGTRHTTAVAAVPASDGRSYAIDLGRYAVMNSSSITGGITRVGITGVQIFQPAVGAGRHIVLGLWTDFPAGVIPGPGTVVNRTATLAAIIQITPGYTPTDVFRLTWQGALPGLSGRRGVVGRLPSGEVYAAVQIHPADGSAQWAAGAQLLDPAVGVRVGDVVTVAPDDPAVCPAGAEPTVAGVLAPQAAFPGGAVRLAPGTCLDALAAGQVALADVTILAGGLVLASDHRGYLGRPPIDQIFALQYDPREGTGDPTLDPEARAVARKVRRRHYASDPACAVQGCYGGLPWLLDPFAPGPALAMKIGLLDPAQPGVHQDPFDPAVLAAIPRGAQLIIGTQSGLTPTYRKPISGGVVPTAIVSYDKSPLPGHTNDPTSFYAVYLDDQVLDFTPSTTTGTISTIR